MGSTSAAPWLIAASQASSDRQEPLDELRVGALGELGTLSRRALA